MNTSDIIKNFEGLRVIVLGDLMLDNYVAGDVERISPEAPVPVLKVREEFHSLGGAANVGLNLKALGAKVELIGAAGKDSAGDVLVNEVKLSGINSSGIVRDPSVTTTVKKRIMAANQQIARIDYESTEPANSKLEDSMISKLEKAIANSNPAAVVISDYAKGALTNKVLSRAINICRKRGILTVVDPKGEDFSKYKGADVITPNKSESEAATGIKITDQRSLGKAGRAILKSAGTKAALITLGRGGIAYLKKSGKVNTVKSIAKEVYDVTGAGDTVISAFTLSYAISSDLSESVRIANAAAGISVGRLGASQVQGNELQQHFLTPGSAGVSKILPPEILAKKLSQHRSKGDKIVFTNGCFDLFHTGHLKLLTESAALGDVLVVAINSDSSVKRLKGKGRPFVSETDRVKLLSALDCVSYLCTFSENTPLDVIKQLKPDILVKGGDYKVKDVVGGGFVEGKGGKVVIIPLVEGISTTALAGKIKKGKV